MAGIILRNLLFETLEDLRLVVSYQTPVNPTDAEWDAWLAATGEIARKATEFRLLVVTEGGRPNKSQTERLAAVKREMERNGGKKMSEPLTAIITSSAALRFVVSVMMFMNPAIRCFSPAERDRAYAHIALTRVEGTSVDAALERLRASVAL
jgi:hypothetical protein